MSPVDTSSPSLAVARRGDTVPSGPSPGRVGSLAPVGGSYLRAQQHAKTRVQPQVKGNFPFKQPRRLGARRGPPGPGAGGLMLQGCAHVRAQV